MPTTVLGSSTVVHKTGFTANISLLKGGTITQTIIGVVISAAVVTSVIATILMITLNATVNSPIARDDNYQVYKKVPTNFYPLLNDYDPRSANLTILNITQPANGKAVLTSKNLIVYTSQGSFAGNDTFQYTITNSWTTATATINVLVLNRAPDVVDLTYTVNKNSKNNNFDVFNFVTDNGAKTSDIDGDTLSVNELIGAVSDGSSISFDNLFIYYTPAKGFNKEENLNYTVSDGYSNVTASLKIIVSNDAPTAEPDSYTIKKNVLFTLNVMENDFDINGDNITISTYGTGLGSTGTIIVADNGKNLQYIPPAFASTPHTDAFEYNITDGSLSASSYVFVKVVNTPPSAKDLSINVPKNSKNNLIDLTFSDEDILDTVTLTPITKLSRGSSKLSVASSVKSVYYPTGDMLQVTNNAYTLVYSPEPGVVYSEQFQVRVSDGIDSVIATITINVVPTPPIPVNDTATCQKNGQVTVDVIGNDYSQSGDILKLNFVSSTTLYGGKLTKIDDNNTLYEPAHDFTGEDEAPYVVINTNSDGSSDGTFNRTGYVIIKVVNTAPVAVASSFTVSKGLTSSIDPIKNSYDPNGDKISYNSFAQSTYGLAISFTQGNTFVNYTALSSVYVDYVEFDVVDVEGLVSNKAIATINVINNAPVPIDDLATVSWNRSVVIDVLANDKDVNGDSLTVHSVSYTSNNGATVSIYQGGKTILYVPRNGYVGNDTFTYTCTDGMDASVSSATVTVSVTNEAPVAGSVTARTHWRSSSVNIPVLTSCTDADGDSLHISSFTQGSKGSVSRVTLGDGTDGLVYTSIESNNYVGTDSFTYVVSDYDKSTIGTVSVEVTNTVPVSNDDSYTMHWRSSNMQLHLLTNDVDADTDPITIKSFAPTAGFAGNLVLDSSKSFMSYTPSASGLGVKNFTYTSTDGPSTSNTATVSITVTNNDKPEDRTISKTVHWSTQTTGSVINIFSIAQPVDNDGDSLSIISTPVQNPTSGSITISNGDSTTAPYVLYKQNSQFLGSDSFQVQVTDGSSYAVVTVNVVVYDNAPVSNDVSETRHFTEVSNGYTKNAVAWFNATDSDSQDTITVQTASVTSCGSVSFTTSTVTFTSAAGSTGVCVVSVVFTDGLLTTTAKWNINVQNVAPVAAPFTTIIHWTKNQSLIDIASSLSDVDGDSLSYSVSSFDNSYGTPTINNDKVVVWNLPQNVKLGTSQLTITYTDGWTSKTASYPVTIQNAAPTAVSKTVVSKWSACVSGITIDILSECSDTDGDSISFDSSTPIVTAPTQGSATIDSSKVVYKQSTASIGTYSFTYRITDGIEKSVNTITVDCTDNAPIATSDSVTVQWNTSFVDINVLVNDADSDNDALTVTNPSTVSEGSLSVVNNMLRYTLKTPPTLGSKTFTYKAYDGALYSSDALVTVTIVNANQPQISDQSTNAHWRTVQSGVSYTVYNTLTDADGDHYSLSFDSGSSPFCSLVDLGNSIKGVKYLRSAFASSDVCKVILSDGFSTSSATLTTNSYNSAPVAANLTLSYSGGNIQYGITINVISSATDADIQDVPYLKVVSVGDSSMFGNGAAQITADGQILYFPNSSLVKTLGIDTVPYTISDGLSTSTGYLKLNISSTAPSSTEQYYNVHFRYSTVGFVFTPLDKISESGADLDAASNPTPDHGGSVVIAGDLKTVTYRPSGTYLGAEQFTLNYNTQSGSSYIVFTMTIYDTAPAALPISGSVHFGQSTTFNLTAYSSDADPLDVNNLSFSANTQPSQGSLSVSSNIATFSASNTVGTFTATYTVSDSMKTSTGSITVNVINTAPTSQTKTISVPWRTFKTGFDIDILNHVPADFDVDGDSLSLVSIASQPSVGTVSVLDSKTVRIVGSGNYVGSLSFKYIVTDGASNGQVTTTVNLIVYNNAPVAVPDKLTTHWNVASYTLDVTANDTDANSDPLTVTNVYGSLASVAPTFTSNSIVYYPRTAPSTDTVYYTISDLIATSTSTVSVTVTNNAPTTTSPSFVGSWSTAKNGLTFNVVAASSDANGDSLSLQSCSSTITASQGNVTCSGDVKFTPSSGFVGSINPITYVITDGRDTVSGTVSITILNNAPTANTTNTFRYHWRSVLSNTVIDLSSSLKDVDGDAVTLTAVTKTLVGTATLGSGNTIIYKVSNAYTGTDSVTVSFTDGWSTSTATFNILIYNNVPVTKDISVSSHTSTVSIPVIDRSDSFKPTDADSNDSAYLRISSFTNPSVGTVTLSSDKKSFTYTNANGNSASQSFTYIVSDELGFSVAKSITVTISNSVPTATPLTFSHHWARVQSGFDINLLSSVSDADGDSLTVLSFSQPNSGAVVTVNSTSVKYTPVALTAGFTTSFTYIVSDGFSSVTNTVTITITNTPPVAVDNTFTQHWTNNTLYLKPVLNDYDVDGDYIYINKLYPSTFTTSYNGIGDYIIISKGSTICNNFANLVVPGSIATAGFVSQALTPTGTLSVNNAAYTSVVTAASNLYQYLAQKSCVASLDQNFPTSGVLSFTPGVYCFSQGLNGNGKIELSGSGLYIFVATTNLNANFSWSFKNGASYLNVFWLVGAAGIQGTFYGHVLTYGQLNFNVVSMNGVIMSLGSSSLNLNNVNFGNAKLPTGSTALVLQSDLVTVYYKNTFINGPTTDSFQYTITDRIATSNVATVNLVFTNTAPTATSFSQTIGWKNTLSLTNVVSQYCSDADADSLSLFGVVQGSYGTTTVSDYSTGALVYTPRSAISYTSTYPNGTKYITDSVRFGCYDGAQVVYATMSVIVRNTPPSGSAKTASIERSYSNPTYTFTNLLTGASDADGDTVTVSSVAMITQNTGASVLLNNDGSVKLTYATTYLGTLQFSFTLSDGQLTSTYTYTVTITGNSFGCLDYTVTTTKNSGATQFEDALRSSLTTKVGSEPVTLAITNTATLNSVGTISSAANGKFTYTPTSTSSSNSDCYASYSLTNTAGQTATCKIIIAQPNQAPTLNPYTYTYSISRASNNYITFDYITLSSSKDVDTSDTLVLKNIVSTGTCNSTALQSLAIDSNQIKFLRVATFIGSCKFVLSVADSDTRNPITNNVEVQIVAIASPPVAVNDFVSTQFNTYIDISVSSLLSNDYDSLGGTFTFAGISCPVGDSSYCTSGTPTILNPSDPANNRIIRVYPVTGSCNSQKFVYTIQSNQDGTSATAVVSVQYTKCQCGLNLDIIFVIDGSGSITADNFVNMKNFASNLTTGFGSNISPTGTNIGIVQFASTVTTHLDLSQGTSQNAVLNTIKNMAQLKSGTNSISGVNTAVNMMLASGRKSISQKLLIHITDGLSNAPCSCGGCRATYSSNPGSYGVSPSYCKSQRFPGADCTVCSWNHDRSRCNPCSDATVRSVDINSWSVGGANNAEKSLHGSVWNWRQLAVGIGSAVTDSYGQIQVQKMNYDQNNLVLVNWNDLSNVYQTIIDNSCNVVDTSKTNVLVPLASSGYTVKYLGKTLSTTTFLNSNSQVSVFTYNVSVATGSPSLTRFTLELQPGYNQDAFYDYNPSFPVYIGADSITGLTGFSYLSLPNSYTIAAGSYKIYTLKIAGDIPENVIKFGVAGGSQYSQGTITGPSGIITAVASSLPAKVTFEDFSWYRKSACSTSLGRCYYFTKLQTYYPIEAMSTLCKYFNPNATLVQIQSAAEKTFISGNVLPKNETLSFFLGTKGYDVSEGSYTKWADGSSISYVDWYSSYYPDGNPIVYAYYMHNAPNYGWWATTVFDGGVYALLCYSPIV